jgi:hypothetical protein
MARLSLVPMLLYVLVLGACDGTQPTRRSLQTPTAYVGPATLAEVSSRCAGGNDLDGCSAAMDQACREGIASSCKVAEEVRAAKALKRCAADETLAEDRTAECAAAAARFEASCSGGSAEACAFARAIRARETQRTSRRCDEHSVSECMATCDRGNLDACVDVASMYLQGSRVARDLAKGGEVMRVTCTKGSVRACFMHGSQFQVLDPGPAAASLKSACSSDDETWSGPACGMLLGMLDRGAYAPSRADRLELLRHLCERERAAHSARSACGRLEDIEASDRAVPPP